MKRALLLLAALTLTVAACGSGGGGASTASDNDGRIIEIEMRDNVFRPGRIEVASGESVRFVFKNAGTVTHDAYIGDKDEQADHGEEMRSGGVGGGGMHHGGGGVDKDGLSVEPGATRTLPYTFDEPGSLIIGCHEPGHYESGMRIAVTVT